MSSENVAIDPSLKSEIDNMSQYEMCRIWRFGGRDDLLRDSTGAYFREVLTKKSGFTPEISKLLGWTK
jgi:hypothetical protein